MCFQHRAPPVPVTRSRPVLFFFALSIVTLWSLFTPPFPSVKPDTFPDGGDSIKKNPRIATLCAGYPDQSIACLAFRYGVDSASVLVDHVKVILKIVIHLFHRYLREARIMQHLRGKFPAPHGSEPCPTLSQGDGSCRRQKSVKNPLVPLFHRIRVLENGDDSVGRLSAV